MIWCIDADAALQFGVSVCYEVLEPQHVVVQGRRSSPRGEALKLRKNVRLSLHILCDSNIPNDHFLRSGFEKPCASNVLLLHNTGCDVDAAHLTWEDCQRAEYSISHVTFEGGL